MIYFDLKQFIFSKLQDFDLEEKKRFILFLENLFEKSLYNFSDEDFKKLKKYIDKYIFLIKNYPKNYPLEYILKKTFFFGYKFFINRNVLIPRKDTECLVEIALNLILRKKFFSSINFLKSKQKINILDLACGSGCIGISLANELKKYNIDNFLIYFSDISIKALKVCKLNLKFYNLQFPLILQDRLKATKEFKFNIILSNPPYVEKNSPFLKKSCLYEPYIALFASLDSLKFWAMESYKALKENGIYIFECAPYQVKSLKSFLKTLYTKVEIYFDYNQLPRGFICYKGL